MWIKESTFILARLFNQKCWIIKPIMNFKKDEMNTDPRIWIVFKHIPHWSMCMCTLKLLNTYYYLSVNTERKQCRIIWCYCGSHSFAIPIKHVSLTYINSMSYLKWLSKMKRRCEFIAFASAMLSWWRYACFLYCTMCVWYTFNGFLFARILYRSYFQPN